MIHAIASIDKNRGIGFRNKLLWRLPADMQRFVSLTTGHIVIMGRMTYESIGHALPNRHNIVISNSIACLSDAVTFRTVEQAIHAAKVRAKQCNCEIFIIGGQSIYKQCLPYCDQLDLTIIDKSFASIDKWFPKLDDWQEFYRELGGTVGKTTFVFTKWRKRRVLKH